MASSLDPSCMNSGRLEMNDPLSIERVCAKEDLELVENALICILQEENPLPTPEHELRKAGLARRLHDGADMEDRNASPQDGLRCTDLYILSKLLNQVQHLKREQYGCALSSGDSYLVATASSQNSQMDSKHSHALMERGSDFSENIVETMVSVANAAAEAAKSAAASTAKNLEVMELLVTSSTESDRQIYDAKQSGNTETSHKECSGSSGIDDQSKDLVKRVEGQNRVTHWILGLMVITTAIWRFKMLSMFFGVRRTLANPFQAIADKFSGGSKGPKEDCSSAKGFQKAHTLLPSLLQGGAKESSKKEQSTFEDFKIGEGLTLSLDNILSVGKSSSTDTEGNVGGTQSEQ